MNTPAAKTPRTPPTSRWSDHAVEQLVGRLLQTGVLAAAAIVLVGGVLLLVRHGSAPVSYSVFHGEPELLRSIGAIVRGALAMDPQAVVQLGLLLLIATPVARVALTLVAFILQHDRTYVLITSVVLALLLYGLIFDKT
ncbi:MAG: hypothetical protein JWM41_1242 [Gemmatimonadetes bacterium]|nr:hypothetical protein [Gemmatimonadota bacterium]